MPLNLPVFEKALERATMQDLKAMNSAVVSRMRTLRSEAERLASFDFHPGDRVMFTGKRRAIVYGEIEKCNQKTAKVRAQFSGVLWTVSYSLLRKAD